MGSSFSVSMGHHMDSAQICYCYRCLHWNRFWIFLNSQFQHFNTTITSISCFCPCSLPTELWGRHSFPGIPEVWEQVQWGNWGKVPLCRFITEATFRNSRICWRLHKGVDYGWGVLHHSPPGTMIWVEKMFFAFQTLIRFLLPPDS